MRATVDIAAGEEVCIAYIDVLQSLPRWLPTLLEFYFPIERRAPYRRSGSSCRGNTPVLAIILTIQASVTLSLCGRCRHATLQLASVVGLDGCTMHQWHLLLHVRRGSGRCAQGIAEHCVLRAGGWRSCRRTSPSGAPASAALRSAARWRRACKRVRRSHALPAHLWGLRV